MSKLVIVESPGKIKNIQKYIGSDYKVVASKGHVRDLPKSKMGIDFDKGFAIQYLEICYNSAEWIKNRVKNQSLKRSFWITFRSRYTFNHGT